MAATQVQATEWGRGGGQHEAREESGGIGEGGTARSGIAVTSLRTGAGARARDAQGGVRIGCLQPGFSSIAGGGEWREGVARAMRLYWMRAGAAGT